MNLIRFAEPIAVSFKKSSGGATLTFEAGRDYVIPNAQLDRLMQDQNIRNRVYKISKLEMRVQNFNVQSRQANPGHGRKLLLFNGSGGYGDAILMWPVARILASMDYEVHIMAEPGNNICWWNFPWIKSVQVSPWLWEMIKLYDHFVFFEAVSNMDEHQDQAHPVDIMLHKIGIDPRGVDPNLKTVRPVFTGLERESTKQWDAKQIGMYQLSATNPVRCLQPADSVFILTKLCEAFPEIHWLALYDEFNNQAYKTMLDEKITTMTLTNVQPYCSPGLRELWALTEKAKIVVAPDSMMVHIAGSLGTPCVGLWGPISPQNRVGYYKNHHAIWHREFCPHAPCFCYAIQFPRYCPPRPTARTTCELLAGISPTEVVDTVRKAIGPSSTTPLLGRPAVMPTQPLANAIQV